ncbi:stage II sporulation protein M [Marinitoga sp. 38H-ov]|uniref:stage II sporulation protein M n=1 Tax=Marinitoga sp. 38H-ov TaxID=1755814 RepID=UPI00169818AE|nr:stage II sporulation protein M [Marinitoga sp. 38H-ov]KAF2955423.1 hypothetical protein AS160_10375 [Marinitoga sp. 38H-ov]
MKGVIILQTLQKYLKNLIVRNKNIAIATIFVYILSLIAIFTITFCTNISKLPDVSDIYEKSVSFFNVFIHNIVLVIQNIFLGLITLGIYGLYVLIQNVIALGSISNSLISHSMIIFVYKMIPHGLIELLGMSYSVVIPYVLYIRGFNAFVKVTKREEKLLSELIKLGLFILRSIIFLVILFFIAAIVEVIVSRIKFMN